MSGSRRDRPSTWSAPSGSHDVELDQHVGRAGGGIALVVDLGALGADRGARDDADRRLVEPLDRDAARRRATTNSRCARSISSCATNSASPQWTVPPPSVVSRAPRRRRAADTNRFWSRTKLTDSRPCGLIAGLSSPPACRSAGCTLPSSVGEIEVAVERHEDRLAVGRPVIGDDAGRCRRSARARAASSRPRKARRRCRPSCESTSIRAWPVVVSSAHRSKRSFSSARLRSERQQRAVGRQLQRARLRTRQIRDWRTRAPA